MNLQEDQGPVVLEGLNNTMPVDFNNSFAKELKKLDETQDPRANLYPDDIVLNGSGGYTAWNYKGKFSGKEQDPSQGVAGVKAVGPPSIMTPNLFDKNGQNLGYAYSLTSLVGRGSTPDVLGVENKLLRDTGEHPWYDVDNYAKEPTTSNIIRWSEENDKFKTKPYKFTDFVFCKHWNKIPNNYLMTLRRFAYPVWDNMEFPGNHTGEVKFYTPISQAVTYMGTDTGNEISNILKFSNALKWKELNSQVHEVSQELPGHDKGPASGLARVLGVLTGEADFNSIKFGGDRPPDPYSNGPYMNRVLGPLNRIDTVKQRDAGLEFNQSFSLEFDYVARPINGVNTKAVMLDILANLLLLTYAEAAFWGGSHRFTGGRPAYPFLGGAGGMQAWYRGDGPEFFNQVANQFSKAAETLGSFFNSFLQNPIESLKSLAAEGGKLAIAKSLAKNRVQIQGLPALLSGAPVGEWHLTIGNPFNPMLMIGNLICTGMEVEFGNELGPDDFPLEMKAIIKLEHGMPRDKAAIESMFNKGKGKIYSLPDEIQNSIDSTSAGIDAPKSQEPNTVSSRGGSNKTSIHRRSIVFGDPKDIDRYKGAIASTPKELVSAFKYGLGYGA